jgi:hypothetical protein
VQRRTLKLIRGYGNLTYEEQLKATHLSTLECRRLRGDLLKVFKILNGFDYIRLDIFFVKRADRTRGHSEKFFKQYSRLDIRKFSFSQRIVERWNRLPDKVVKSKDIIGFKSQLDKHMEQLGEHLISRRLPAPLPWTTEG